VTEPTPLWGVLASMFAVGFLGSVHCLGMCGGIAAALTHAIRPKRRVGSSLLWAHLCFSVGRIGSYVLAGGVAGSAGLVLGKLLGPAGPFVLRCAAGLLLVALGLAVSGWWLGLRRLEEHGARLWSRLAPTLERLRPAESLPRAIGLGALWGWLPCGLVYSALASAMSQGRGLTGALAMLAFGLGTLPALVATGTLARELPRLVRRPQTRTTAGLLILLFGIWTVAAAALTLQPSGGHVH
jgi:sulfite exporter TauE/SafE